MTYEENNVSIFNNKQDRHTKAMMEAMAWLDERGIPYHHLPPYQLKIGILNFWPGRGTITVDGETQRRSEKGIAGLEAILIAKGLVATNHKNIRLVK